MNLASLPQIAFCETDTAQVEAALVADFERITGRTLYPGNPERLFLEALAYLISQQRYLIDHAGKMNLVSLAAGGYLDHLGALLNTTRLGEQAASTTLRFTLVEALGWPLVIPAGARATTAGAGQLYWATSQDLVIEAGQTQGEVMPLPAKPPEPRATASCPARSTAWWTASPMWLRSGQHHP